MDTEEKFQALSDRMKNEIKEASERAVDDIAATIMPYVESDTVANVDLRAQEIVTAILSGRCKPDHDGVIAETSDGIGVKVRVTSRQRDDLRKMLVSVMKSCPKDLEIEALRSEVKSLKRHIEGRPF